LSNNSLSDDADNQESEQSGGHLSQSSQTDAGHSTSDYMAIYKVKSRNFKTMWKEFFSFNLEWTEFETHKLLSNLFLIFSMVIFAVYKLKWRDGKP
jgi:hypothetical protein